MGAFTIFLHGQSTLVRSSLQAFVFCGTRGEKVGWHWGFGAAAVGMILGLVTYLLTRPFFLKHVGDPPQGAGKSAPLFLLGAIALALLIGGLFYTNFFERTGNVFDHLTGSGIWSNRLAGRQMDHQHRHSERSHPSGSSLAFRSRSAIAGPPSASFSSLHSTPSSGSPTNRRALR